MPPKRKSPAVAAAQASSPRKTRSMTAGKPVAGAPLRTPKKGAAVAPLRKLVAGALLRTPKKGVAVAPPPSVAEQKGTKRGKKTAEVEDSGKRVVVEACTQCRQFKIRALKVKEDLESAVPGVSVTINPEKPRRGCLEIREEGGEVFISLLKMSRPFTAMRNLDMDEVINDIAKKIS